MVVIHQLLVDKPLTGSAALSIYLNATPVVGISCYLFTEFVEKRWRRGAHRVISLEQKGGAIEGPYRRFNFRKFDFRKFFGRKEKQHQVWVARGIGTTPFLAWVQSLSEHETVRIYLFYSALNAEEALGLEVLEKAKARLHGFSFDVVFSQSEGRVDADRLTASAPST
jgi:hypothetical protein